jgi:hypothetical protein
MEKQLKEKIRSVVRGGFISELSKNDIHVKEIMKFYDKGTYSTKKAVSIFVSGKTNATRNQILDDLGDMGYNDAWEVMDHFKLKIESIKESELKGYLAADVVDDIVKSIGSKFVSGEIKNAPNRNYIYLKLTNIKFGSGVVKMLKSQFGIDAKIDKTFGNIPSVSFASKKVVSESVNEVAMNPVKKVVNAILKKHGVNAMKTTSTSVKGFHNIQNGGYRYDSDYFLSFYKVPQDIVKKVGAELEKAGVRGVEVKNGMISADFSKTGMVKRESVKEEKVYIDYLNKAKGFKQDRIKFNSYEDAVKWARKNFEKFNPDMIKYESVNETTLNEGFGDSIKKIRNLAIKMASTKYDRAKSHLNLDKIASADDFDGKDTMNKATTALLQQNDLDEDLKSAINKIAVKLGTGATMMGIITALVSMSGWIQYLDSSFTKWYYTEIQKLAEPEVMKVMQDLGRAGQAEGSIYGKLGMYAFFIFFTIAVISLVAARMTQKTKKEYVDKKGVERVAAALPQTEEEPIKECKTCNSK